MGQLLFSVEIVKCAIVLRWVSCCSVWKLSSVLLYCDESVVVLCGSCQVCYCFVMSQLLFCVEIVKCVIVLCLLIFAHFCKFMHIFAHLFHLFAHLFHLFAHWFHL